MNHYELAKLCNQIYDGPCGGEQIVAGPLLAEVIHTDSETVVVFQGTQEPLDWLTNLNAVKVAHPWGQVHAGFEKGWASLRTPIMDAVQIGKPIILTGHSLGGALATRAACDLTFETAELVTFGCPRVGNRAWANHFALTLGHKTTRYHHLNDPVPLLPGAMWGYLHPTDAKWFNGKSWTTLDYWSLCRMAMHRPLAVIDDHAMEHYVDALRFNVFSLLRTSPSADVEFAWNQSKLIMFSTQRRAGKWPAVRAAHLREHPTCEACGGSMMVEVHHVEPLSFGGEELDPNNLMSLCEAPAWHCHRIIGHSGDFKSVNPHARKDAAEMLARIRNRPYPPAKIAA